MRIKWAIKKKDIHVVTVKMPSWFVEAIDNYRKQLGLSRSEVIRRAIAEYLLKHG